MKANWINVNDRAPDNNDEHIIFFKKSDCVGITIGSYYHNAYCDDASSIYNWYVINDEEIAIGDCKILYWLDEPMPDYPKEYKSLDPKYN